MCVNVFVVADSSFGNKLGFIIARGREVLRQTLIHSTIVDQ